MASVGEVKAAMEHAMMKAGEASAVIEAMRVQIGEARESLQSAMESAAAALDGSGHPDCAATLDAYKRGMHEMEPLMPQIEAAETYVQLGNQLAQHYTATI